MSAKLALMKWNEGDISADIAIGPNTFRAHGTEEQVRKDLVNRLRTWANQIESDLFPVEYFREPEENERPALWVFIDKDEFYSK